MARRGEFYAGSKLLENLVPVVGLPLDQLNFLVCQLIGLLFAIPFRTVLSAKNTTPQFRLAVELFAGIALTVFCFGHQIWYLINQAFISYLLMKYGSPKWSNIVVFVFAMAYMSVAHIYRQIYDYGGYTLDITGPMMIQTQKLTSLAFSISDGQKDPSKLNNDQKSQAIKKVPDVLSFFSYMFYFHGVMCGPLAFFSDYMAFIDGSDMEKAMATVSSNGQTANAQDTQNSENKLKNVEAFVKKLLLAALCGTLMVTLPPIFCPPEGLLEESFFNKTFLQKTFYILACLTLARQKYYFAWILGESVNLAAGFGFNGFDASGEPKWDMLDNVSIWGVEFANSLKVNIDAWNKRTLVWLRRVVYDRAPKHQTLAVFAVSAFWHGFYPGYYLTFGTAALFTIAARMMRRNVRPWFQTSDVKRHTYDVITFLFARMANVYITFPFLTLEFVSTLRIYAAMYFWLHLAAIGVIVYFTFVAPSPRKSSRQQPVKQD